MKSSASLHGAARRSFRHAALGTPAVRPAPSQASCEYGECMWTTPCASRNRSAGRDALEASANGGFTVLVVVGAGVVGVVVGAAVGASSVLLLPLDPHAERAESAAPPA